VDNLKEATLQSELRFKDLVINPCHRSVLINNNRIDLTTKEFDLLYFLAIHPGWAFTKSQIYETGWIAKKYKRSNSFVVRSMRLLFIKTLRWQGLITKSLKRSSDCNVASFKLSTFSFLLGYMNFMPD
jgi:DNA-binding response OmpR family regulator